MYETRLGTDWEDISGTEAIRRAYALGVAAAFGYENREEFDRLREALDTSYDRSIIDLAYQEGKHEAEVIHDDTEATDGDAVWKQLIEGTTPPSDLSGPDSAADRSPAGRPISATELPSALERAGLLDGGDDLGALGFPAFLGSAPNSGYPDDES